MFVTDRMWADFVVCTSTNSDNYYCEKVLRNTKCITDMLYKSKIFFERVIFPEFISGAVQTQVISSAVQKLMSSMLDTLSVDHTESRVAYPCGVCQKACLDDLVTEDDRSVMCDICSVWHHFTCIGVTCVTTKRWFCSSCKHS